MDHMIGLRFREGDTGDSFIQAQGTTQSKFELGNATRISVKTFDPSPYLGQPDSLYDTPRVGAGYVTKSDLTGQYIGIARERVTLTQKPIISANHNVPLLEDGSTIPYTPRLLPVRVTGSVGLERYSTPSFESERYEIGLGDTNATLRSSLITGIIKQQDLPHLWEIGSLSEPNEDLLCDSAHQLGYTYVNNLGHA